MKELDAKDRDILAILSKEARIPLKTLAARIGLSRSATSERVALLEKSGVIRGYRADIGQLEQNPARHPEVRRVSSISGQVDLVVEVEVPSIDRLNTLRDLIASHQSVEDLTSLIVLRRDIDRI